MSNTPPGPPADPVLELARQVEQELTLADPDGVFRPAWDVVGPMSWVRCRIRDERVPGGWRVPGSLPEMRESIRGYMDQLIRNANYLQSPKIPHGRGLAILNREARWAPSVAAFWRMAAIIIPTSAALPPQPSVANVADALAALRVLDRCLASLDASGDETDHKADEGTEQQPGAVPADKAEELIKIAQLLGGATAARIISIAREPNLTVEQKVPLIYALNNEYLGWPSTRWAELLDCTGSAVRDTTWWKEDRPRLQRDE